MSLLLRRLCCAESLTPEERDAKVDELVSFVRHAAANHLDTPVRAMSPFAGWGLWIGCEPRVAGGSREPFCFFWRSLHGIRPNCLVDRPTPPLAQVDVTIRMTDEWGISLLNRESAGRHAATSQ